MKAIPEIPKDWKWMKLGELCDVVTGTTPPKSDSLNYGDDIPFFKPPHLWDGMISETEEMLSLKGSEKARVVPPNTVLVTCIGNLGRTGFVKKTAAFNQQINAILENESIGGKFIFYQAQSPLFKKQLEKLATGTTVSIVNKGNFETIDIPLPPKLIQQAIVSKIEELFSELDKGIENLHTAQQQLKTYRQSVLKWAFEGKLTEEWRQQKGNLISAKDLLKKIQAEKEKIAKDSNKKIKPLDPLDDEDLEELFEVPKEWVWVKNEEYLFEVKDGTHDTPKYFESGIPFVTQKNIRQEGLDFSVIQFISKEDHRKFYQRSNVAKGDILISMIGHNRGMTAIVDTDKIFSIKNVGLLKFFPHLQSNRFSFYYYQSRVGLNIVLRKSKGGAQPFIGLTELRNWPVVVCSFEEQNEIVQAIESRLSVADKMEESITQSLQQAEALRQSILKKAFEGRLI